jgi:hypothetical protein
MNYINEQTLEYPITEQTIRNLFPNMSFSSPFAAPAPFASVVLSPKPEATGTTKVTLKTVPVQTGSTWSLGWDTTDKTVDEIDAELTSTKSKKTTEIKKLRDEKLITNGFQVIKVIEGSDPPTLLSKWFHSDTFSRTQQIALFSLGANIPVGLQWKTMDGTFVEMTQQLAADIFAAAVASDAAIFAHAEVLIAEVNASITPATVDIYTGWSEGYVA